MSHRNRISQTIRISLSWVKHLITGHLTKKYSENPRIGRLKDSLNMKEWSLSSILAMPSSQGERREVQLTKSDGIWRVLKPASRSTRRIVLRIHVACRLSAPCLKISPLTGTAEPTTLRTTVVTKSRVLLIFQAPEAGPPSCINTLSSSYFSFYYI